MPIWYSDLRDVRIQALFAHDTLYNCGFSHRLIARALIACSSYPPCGGAFPALRKMLLVDALRSVFILGHRFDDPDTWFRANVDTEMDADLKKTEHTHTIM